jgi:hypothetical protein
MSAFQIENNDLRELSHAEQIKVNGAAACYRNPNGFVNPFRWLSSGSSFAIPQKWNGRAYVNNGGAAGTGGNFGAFCKARGYTYFR